MIQNNAVYIILNPLQETNGYSAKYFALQTAADDAIPMEGRDHEGIKIYVPPGRTAPVAQFIDSLEPKLRDKLIRQLILLPATPRASLREPHYKHFCD